MACCGHSGLGPSLGRPDRSARGPQRRTGGTRAIGDCDVVPTISVEPLGRLPVKISARFPSNECRSTIELKIETVGDVAVTHCNISSSGASVRVKGRAIHVARLSTGTGSRVMRCRLHVSALLVQAGARDRWRSGSRASTGSIRFTPATGAERRSIGGMWRNGRPRGATFMGPVSGARTPDPSRRAGGGPWRHEHYHLLDAEDRSLDRLALSPARPRPRRQARLPPRRSYRVAGAAKRHRPAR